MSTKTVRKRGRPNKEESGTANIAETIDLNKLNLGESRENDRFHMKTGSLLLKQLFECLNSMDLTQVKLEFDPDAIRIREEFDRNQIFVVFGKSNFELDYYVRQPVVLKSDIKSICLYMHNISKGCKYELQAEESDDIRNLNIITQIPESTPTEQNNYNVNSLKVTRLEKNDIEPIVADGYETCLKIKSTTMHQAIKDYGKLSEEIQITYSGKKLVFESRGGTGTMKYIVDFTHDMSAPNDGKIKFGTFRHANLAMFAKCATLGKTLTICLENDKPLILEYEVSADVKISVKIPYIVK